MADFHEKMISTANDAAQGTPSNPRSITLEVKSFETYPQHKNAPVTVAVDTMRLAEQRIVSCEACTPDLAEVPFEHVLDCLTESDPKSTDYLLPEPARCPHCAGAIYTGYWRWFSSEEEGLKVLIVPGTLVKVNSVVDE